MNDLRPFADKWQEGLRRMAVTESAVGNRAAKFAESRSWQP